MGSAEYLFLLGGLKWTLALSAAGFLGGGVVGIMVALIRTSGQSGAGACECGLYRAVPGHAAADAALRRLLRPRPGRRRSRCLVRRGDRLHAARERLPRRDLARRRSRPSRRARPRRGAPLGLRYIGRMRHVSCFRRPSASHCRPRSVSSCNSSRARRSPRSWVSPSSRARGTSSRTRFSNHCLFSELSALSTSSSAGRSRSTERGWSVD